MMGPGAGRGDWESVFNENGGFSWEDAKVLERTVGMVAQQCECALVPPSHAPKNGHDGEFYIMYNLPW